MTGAIPLNSGAVVQAKASKIGNVVARGGESEWLQEAASMLGGCVVTELLSEKWQWQAQPRDIALQ